MVRALGSIVLGTLFVTGCLFPSFDDMQNSAPSKQDEPAQDQHEVTAKSTGVATDSTTDASVVVAPTTDAGSSASTDASPDVATVSPGAGKIACNGQQCNVGPNSHCCAGYTLASGPYCSSPSHTIGWCTGGGGRAVFCDEKADCPGSQICCEKGDVTQCSDTCSGKALP